MTDHAAPIRKVLAVYTGAEADAALLAAASDFAERNGASLTVFSVVETPPDAKELARAADIDIDVALGRLVEERQAAILALAQETVPGKTPAIQVRVGRPFIEIIRHVVDEGVDFVLKTAEPLRGVQKFLFASTDQHLLRKCPCSVWLRRSDAPRTIGTVLAAVDVDLEDADEPETLAALNMNVMETAARLAPVSGAPVTVLHAWDAPGESLVQLWSSGPDTGADAAAYVAAVHAGRTRAMQALATQAAEGLDAAGLDRPGFRTALKRGAPRTVIAEQAKALNADILVIGTVARTGLHGVIIGNTAEDVLNSIECSVVAVKPPGFETPLDFSD